MLSVEIINIVKVFAPATVAFIFGILGTPLLTHYLYKNKMWKKQARTLASDGRKATIVNSLHAETEVRIPKMGGVVIWGSVLLTTILFWFLSSIDGELTEKINFLSRNQTWLPLFTLFIGALVGLLDDYLEVQGASDYFAGGLSLNKRLIVVTIMGFIGSWWFYEKLDVASIIIPFFGELNLGLLFIPFFVITTLAIYAGGVIDGVDGLAGGVFATIFGAYGLIAFFQNQIDLATFSVVVVGGLLAFLWFNIQPARFYMAETGSMALTLSLTVVAFLTKQVAVLPIIAFLPLITAASSAIQLASKRFRDGKQIFKAAPLHHHLQASGWPSYKITMRYWVVGIIFAIIGVIIALIG
jgi:phospho-N-acetylmuramoyl-pentapeptide-transferase